MSRKQQRRKEGGVDDIDTQVQSELLLEMTIMASEPGLINSRMATSLPTNAS